MLCSSPIKEALIPILEATDRSMLPVMIINTTGNIINPISTKSEDVRERLRASRKNGEIRVLINTSKMSRPTNIHSQRRKLDSKERGGAYSLIRDTDFDSAAGWTVIALSAPHGLRSTCRKLLRSGLTNLEPPTARMVRCGLRSMSFG